MLTPYERKVVAHINRKHWWHVPPQDPQAYAKRGKFLASSFEEAEFYGRPLDQPERVLIQFPLVGDEPTIERRLFGHGVKANWSDVRHYRRRVALDGKMKRVALRKGYDSIVLLSRPAFAALKAQGKIPRTIELNILRPVTLAGRQAHAI